MKTKKEYLFFIIILILILIFFYFQARNNSKIVLSNSNKDVVDIASIYCLQHNGTIKDINNEKICFFDNNKSCEEWDFYNKECVR